MGWASLRERNLVGRSTIIELSVCWHAVAEKRTPVLTCKSESPLSELSRRVGHCQAD
jgi:hypothetical protein